MKNCSPKEEKIKEFGLTDKATKKGLVFQASTKRKMLVTLRKLPEKVLK